MWVVNGFCSKWSAPPVLQEMRPNQKSVRLDIVTMFLRFSKIAGVVWPSWPQGVRPKQPRGYGFSPKKRAAAAAAGDSLEM